MAAELERRGYTYAEAQIAERYILQGPPVQYRILTIHDFTPTPEDLAKIGVSVADLLAREYEHGAGVGYQQGFNAGVLSEAERIEQSREYLRERTAAAEAVDLTARINMLLAREEAVRHREDMLIQREAALAEREKRFDKRMGVSEIKHAESTTPTPAICAEPVSTLGDALRDVAKQQGIKISPTNHKEKTT
jgi:hypothetical protein